MIQLCLRLLFCFFFLSCVSQPKKQEYKAPSPKAEQDFANKMKSFQSKPNEANLQALIQFAKSNPDIDLSNEANLSIGDHLLSQGKEELALKYYQAIIFSPYFSSKEWIARIKAAKILWEQKDSYQALEILDPIFKYQSPPNVLLEAHSLRSEIYLFRNDKVEALKSLVFLAKNTKEEQKASAFRWTAQDIVENKLEREELMLVAGSSQFDFLRPYALFRMGTTYFEESSFSKAESYLEDVVSYDKNSALAEQANDLLYQIYSRSKVNSKTIGVILPLSGRLKPLGYKTLSGIQLGLGVFGSEKSNFKLAIIDSEANAAVARRAVETLVTKDHVIAILGDLKGASSLAIARKAQELGVPNISFSLNSELSETGDFVFRNALTSHMQVKNLVRTAMDKYKAQNFAILYPNDSYGVEFANIFWDEVLSKGGQVKAAQAYSSGETDFKDSIKRLVGTYYREDRVDEYKLRYQQWLSKYGERSRRKIPEDLLPPIIDFDAIFIPDTSKALGQIAPMLEFNDVKSPLLIGTNLWNTNSIAKRAGGFSEKLLFVDTDTNTSEARNISFRKNFESEFGRSPDSYEAIAYETAKLLKDLILDQRISTRSELKDALLSVKIYPSPLGQISINEIGDIERPLKPLHLQNGKIQELENKF